MDPEEQGIGSSSTLWRRTTIRDDQTEPLLQQYQQQSFTQESESEIPDLPPRRIQQQQQQLITPTQTYNADSQLQEKRNELILNLENVIDITNESLNKLLHRGDDLGHMKKQAEGLGNVSDMFKKRANETSEEVKSITEKNDWMLWLIKLFICLCLIVLSYKMIVWMITPIKSNPPIYQPIPSNPPPSGGYPMPPQQPYPGSMMCYCTFIPMPGAPQPQPPSPPKNISLHYILT